MKIAVSSTGTDIRSPVDPRFGRAAWFLIVDSDTMQAEAIQNPNITAAGGAGIQSAQLLAERGVQAVLTGNCGPNAYDVLAAAGIEVVTGVSGTVEDAVKLYLAGDLTSSVGPNVTSHFGAGSRFQGSGGMRMGGRGRGGMGRGGRGGMGRGFGSGGAGPMQPTGIGELEMLKQQAETLRTQLEQISRRIGELENKRRSE